MRDYKAAKAARMRQLLFYKRVLYSFVIVCLCFVIMFFVLYLKNLNNSKASASTNQNITYLSVEVSEGQTLSEIASIYAEKCNCDVSEYMEQIASLNNINKDEITSGSFILVPVIDSNY